MNTTRTHHHPLAALLLAAACTLATSAAHAQATIDQNKALAGSITPGDTAGFPITLSQPGSYKLMSNLYVPADTAGIVITADNVSIDLNGFAVIGPSICTQDSSTFKPTCTGTALVYVHGIDGSNRRNVAVRNGTVQGFRQNGVFISEGLVDGVRALHNGSYGVYVAAHGVITNSVAEYNLRGFYTYFGSIVNCSAGFNGTGFDGASAQAVMTNSAARSNAIGFAGGALHGVAAYGNKVDASVGVVKSLGNNLAGGVLF